MYGQTNGNANYDSDISAIERFVDGARVLRWADPSSASVNTWVSNFGNVGPSGEKLGYNLSLKKGAYLIIGQYSVTGGDNDAGIRLYVSEENKGEVFTYRGKNSSWYHPVRIIMSVTIPSGGGSVRIGYYLNQSGTIRNPMIIAIPMKHLSE